MTFDEQLERAISLAGAHEAELLAYPGVVAVGAGPKRTAGVLTGDAAIVVTVRAKADVSQQLPREIEGIPVDVVEERAPVEAPEIIEAQRIASGVLDDVRDEWLAEPNVTGIGVAYKTTAGVTDYRQIALTIFVEHKVPAAEVSRRGWREVPSEINGVVTDVEQLGRMWPTSSASGSRDDRKDPLVGGITVGVNSKPFWYGTLGAIVFDRTTGDQLVLSNQHVLDGPVGQEVVQPSPIGLDDSLELGFQLDICAPIHFFRLDTPNTTVGSVLAGAAVACATAAALSDEIDPTRRGQDATVPPAGSVTTRESHTVSLSYPEMPIPGTHFDVQTKWSYTRHTDSGDFSHSADETKTNPHVLADKILLTDRLRYQTGETVRLYALVLPEPCAPSSPPDDGVLTREEIGELGRRTGPRPAPLSAAVGARAPAQAMAARLCNCSAYQVTALLTPVKVDRAFPIVLRQPVRANKTAVLNGLLHVLEEREDEELLKRATRIVRYGCVYTGTMSAANVPIGPWKHYLYVQTVNTATANMKPTQAAQIIGGLPVSQNTTPQLDVACGPLIVDDGQFEIDPL